MSDMNGTFEAGGGDYPEVSAELEAAARALAAFKIASRDPTGSNLPDDIWRQAVPEALAVLQSAPAPASPRQAEVSNHSRDFELMLARIIHRYQTGRLDARTIAGAQDLLARKGSLSPLRDNPAPASSLSGRGGEGKETGASAERTELPSKAHAPTDHGPAGGYLSRGPAAYVIVDPDDCPYWQSVNTDPEAAWRRTFYPHDKVALEVHRKAGWRCARLWFDAPALGTEAGTAETKGLGPKDEGPATQVATPSPTPTDPVAEARAIPTPHPFADAFVTCIDHCGQNRVAAIFKTSDQAHDAYSWLLATLKCAHGEERS